jgi:catalase
MNSAASAATSSATARWSSTTAGPLSQVSDEIRQRQLGHFDKADPACGAGVRAALKARGVAA